MKIIFISRRKTPLIITCGLIILALFSLIITSANRLFSRARTEGPLGQLTILIDPGHGGVDGGAADDHGNLEKNINLDMGMRLRDQLKQSGLNVLMTRETDTDLSPFISGKVGRHRRDLLARVEKARQSNCLVLISIHCDWSEARSRQGVVAFYNYRSSGSKELALLIQEEVNKVQKIPQKAAPGKYFIIRQQGITGVIVEVGFLSNKEDAALLRNSEYQETLALAISRGILNYCRYHTPALKNETQANDIIHETGIILPQCPAEITQ